MAHDDLTRRIILGDIQRDRVGRTLTPQAQEKAADHAMTHTGSGFNFGQLKEIGIKHVTADVLKP
jgi:hypothetical protein